MSATIHYIGRAPVIEAIDLNQEDTQQFISLSQRLTAIGVELDLISMELKKVGYLRHFSKCGVMATDLFEMAKDLIDDAEFQINEIFETENQKEPLDLSVYFEGKPEV